MQYIKDKKSEIWNRRNKDGGEPYKRLVTDPIILRLIKPTFGKVVVDGGCGNGHLSKKIAKRKPKKIFLLDYYEGNLKFARKNLIGLKGNFKFIQADFQKSIRLDSEIADYVISSFVLNELENIKKINKETFRILKPGGFYVIAVLHPLYDLTQYLSEKLTGQSSKKLKPTLSYFEKGKSSFVFNPGTIYEITAPNYHRTIEDYFFSLKKIGFVIDQIIEPKINMRLLKNAKRFKSDVIFPISLIIKAIKPR